MRQLVWWLAFGLDRGSYATSFSCAKPSFVTRSGTLLTKCSPSRRSDARTDGLPTLHMEQHDGTASGSSTTASTNATLQRALLAAVDKCAGPVTVEDDWKRLRNYLYRSTSCNKKLSPKQIERVLLFLSNNFDSTVVRHIIQSTPRIFRRSVPTQLDPTLDFLKSLYSDQLLNHALQCRPELLLTRGIGYSAPDELDLLQIFLSRELQMSEAQIRKLQNSGSFIFRLPMHKVLLTVAFFRGIMLESDPDKEACPTRSEEMVRENLKKLILKNPNLLQLSLEANLRPRIEYIRNRCNLKAADVALLLQSSSAGILSLSVKENLAPKLDYLEEVFHQGKSSHRQKNETVNLRSCVLAHPQILGLSLQNLHAKVTYLNSISCPSPIDDSTQRASVSLAARVLIRAPSVYSLSLAENIIPTVELMARIWGFESDLPNHACDAGDGRQKQAATSRRESATKDSLAALIGEYPWILTLSLERNIVPTVRFFNRTGYVNLDADWRNMNGETATLLRGRYIASSLHMRLLPRWHYVYERQDGDDNNAMDRLSLHVLASSTDQAFCKHMRTDHEDFLRYKVDAIPRLQFSSLLDSWLPSGGVLLGSGALSTSLKDPTTAE